MKYINQLVRPNILSLKPYSSARDEFKGKEGIFLDANESPFGNLNRYPDPYQRVLKEKLSALKKVPIENIFIGNGSDEVIDLAFRIFCRPQQDKIITCPPTYGLYEVAANINDIEMIQIPLKDDFQLDINKIFQEKERDEKGLIKMIFLCSPNNPTGNILKDVETVLENFDGIVFVDEAYIDFSPQNSLLSKIKKYPNLIVSQTFSKAWGKAAIRAGIAYANQEIIAYYNKVKPPYNMSQLNQNEAVKTLEQVEEFDKNLRTILEQKAWLIQELESLNFVEKVYPSDANFVLVKTKNANLIYQKLVEHQIVIRNRHSVVENCIRITVGDVSENLKLINVLKTMF